ncbi:hypothetical protein HanXRQr2_Chr09g0390281 [Helianthus annuus]|uniref:Uncharacterized protein n=1 Tax=Helianthus annuus TaxID=4232 RepID=A0A9K3I6Z0_HELAN|nr:hypothetical protein HanXRQr2_Chr09g0390281 [Helianthus annuus]
MKKKTLCFFGWLLQRDNTHLKKSKTNFTCYVVGQTRSLEGLPEPEVRHEIGDSHFVRIQQPVLFGGIII